jgi:hypothetical protein
MHWGYLSRQILRLFTGEHTLWSVVFLDRRKVRDAELVTMHSFRGGGQRPGPADSCRRARTAKTPRGPLRWGADNTRRPGSGDAQFLLFVTGLEGAS